MGLYDFLDKMFFEDEEIKKNQVNPAPPSTSWLDDWFNAGAAEADMYSALASDRPVDWKPTVDPRTSNVMEQVLSLSPQVAPTEAPAPPPDYRDFNAFQPPSPPAELPSAADYALPGEVREEYLGMPEAAYDALTAETERPRTWVDTAGDIEKVVRSIPTKWHNTNDKIRAELALAAEDVSPASLIAAPIAGLGVGFGLVEELFKTEQSEEERIALGDKSLKEKLFAIAKGIEAAGWDGSGGTFGTFQKNRGMAKTAGEQMYEEADAQIKKDQLDFKPNSPMYHFNAALDSVVMNAPGLVMGVITRNPKYALGLMQAAAFFDTYGTIRSKAPDLGIATALAGGYISGKFEKETERLPFDALIKQGSSFGKRVIGSTLLEVPGEMIATAGQEGLVGKATYNPNMTMTNFVDAEIATVIQTLMAAAAQGPMAHVLSTAVDKMDQYQTNRSIANDIRAGVAGALVSKGTVEELQIAVHPDNVKYWSPREAETMRVALAQKIVNSPIVQTEKAIADLHAGNTDSNGFLNSLSNQMENLDSVLQEGNDPVVEARRNAYNPDQGTFDLGQTGLALFSAANRTNDGAIVDSGASGEAVNSSTIPNGSGVITLFRSGSEGAAHMGGYIDAGVPIGVEVGKLTGPTTQTLVEYANNGGQVFIDSGAFPAFRAKKPTTVNFDQVLSKYEKITNDTSSPGNITFVAPDVIGNQEKTLSLLTQHQARVNALQSKGANIMVPIQRGSIKPSEYWTQVVKAFGPKAIVGIPSNQNAFTPDDLQELLTNTPVKRIHFLGMSHKSDKWPALKMITDQYPGLEISMDANRYSAKVGRKPLREITRRRDDLQQDFETEEMTDEPIDLTDEQIDVLSKELHLTPEQTKIWKEEGLYELAEQDEVFDGILTSDWFRYAYQKAVVEERKEIVGPDHTRQAVKETAVEAGVKSPITAYKKEGPYHEGERTIQTPERRKAVESLADIQDWITGITERINTRTGLYDYVEVGRIFDDLKELKAIDLVGQTAKSFGDIYSLLRLARNRHVECMHIIYQDEETGEVLENEVYSSRLPGSVNVPSASAMAKIIEDTIIRIEEDTNRKTRVVISHNHPSGNIDASDADKAFTSNLANELDRRNIALSGHIVLDHNKYGLINPRGEESQHVLRDIPAGHEMDYLEQGQHLPHDMLGKTFTKTSAPAAISKSIRRGEHYFTMLVRSGERVVGIINIHKKFLQDLDGMKSLVRETMINYGGQDAFIYTDSLTDDEKDAAKTMIRIGILRDGAQETEEEGTEPTLALQMVKEEGWDLDKKSAYIFGVEQSEFPMSKLEMMTGTYGISGLSKKEQDRALANLDVAKRMAREMKITRLTHDNRIDMHRIRFSTGWHLWADGEWRYEIDDTGMTVDVAKINPPVKTIKKPKSMPMPQESVEELSSHPWLSPEQREYLYKIYTQFEKVGYGTTAYDKLAAKYQKWINTQTLIEQPESLIPKLKDVIKHPLLFKMYPTLRSLSVRLDAIPSGIAHFSSRDWEIVFKESLFPIHTRDNIKSTLLHEIQHAIQSIEHFEGGASPLQFKKINNPEWKDASRLNKHLNDAWTVRYIERQEEVDTEAAIKLVEKWSKGLLSNVSKNYARTLTMADIKAKQDEIRTLLADDPEVLLPDDQYMRNAGEAESRLTQRRRFLNREGRADTPFDLDLNADVLTGKNIFKIPLAERNEIYRELLEAESENNNPQLEQIRGRYIPAVTKMAQEDSPRGALAQKALDIQKKIDKIRTKGGMLRAYNDAKKWLESNTEYIFSTDPDLLCQKSEGCDLAINQLKNVLGDKYTPDLGWEVFARAFARGLKTPCPQCYVYWARKASVGGTMQKKIILGIGGYNGELLRKKKSTQQAIMRRLQGLMDRGLRHYSSTDFKAEHIPGLIIEFIEAETAGIPITGYSKEPDFFTMFAETGAYINVSMGRNRLVGLDYKEGLKIRNNPKYKNVSSVWIGFNDDDILAALRHSGIDHVIPWHASMAKIEDMRKILKDPTVMDYTSQQHETVEHAGGKGGRKNAEHDISEMEHGGDLETYLRLCKERGVEKKFPQLYNLLGKNEKHLYMKLVGPEYGKFQRGRRDLGDGKLYTTPDSSKIKTSVSDAVIKRREAQASESLGGYTEVANELIAEVNAGTYTPMDELIVAQGALDIEDDFINRMAMAKAIREAAGKKKNPAGLQEKDASYMEAVDRDDMKTAQRMVDAKAKETGHDLELWHGDENRPDKTVFEPSKWRIEKDGKNPVLAFMATSPEGSGAYGEPKRYYVKFKKTLDAYSDAKERTIPQWKAWFKKKGIDNVAIDTGINEDSLLGAKRFQNDPSARFVFWELLGPGSYWRKDGNLATRIVESGYDSIRYSENGDDSYIAMEGASVKSSDPVTYNQGKIIPLSERFNPEQDSILREPATMYDAKVTDPVMLKKLNSEPTIKVFRAMQTIDGKLYPPMSALVKGKLRPPTEIGVWERAKEAPELATSTGHFKLEKGNKKSLSPRYNPYFHTSRSPLNDQFSEAYNRPNLVTVEVEIPASELTSGYKAEKAKDAVGEIAWHKGPVSSKLPKAKARSVILSRYAKVVRVVPDSEVAEHIAKLLKGENISVPANVVTPSLRKELSKRGVNVVGNAIIQESDAAYMKAVDKGDMKTAQKMVDAKAKMTGYDVGPVYHGRTSKFDVFDLSKMKDKLGFFFSNKLQAGQWGDPLPVFLSLRNPARIKVQVRFGPEPPKDMRYEKILPLGMTEEQHRKRLIDQDYDGVIIDWGEGLVDHIAFYPNQIKSADPVTYDKKGKIIPLSERFNPDEDSILQEPAATYGEGPFFSHLDQVVSKRMRQKMHKEQLMRMLRKKGVTLDEMRNLLPGLPNKVTVQEVKDTIAANTMKLKDVVLKEPTHQSDEKTSLIEEIAWDRFEVMFEDSPLDFGDVEDLYDQERKKAWLNADHRIWTSLKTTRDEYLRNSSDADKAINNFYADAANLSLDKIFSPTELRDIKQNAWDSVMEQMIEQAEDEFNEAEDDFEGRINNRTEYGAYVEPYALAGTYRELFVTAPPLAGTGTWHDGHEPYDKIVNPIVRLRYNIRVAPDGQTLLFIEEIQGPSSANQEKMPKWLVERIYDIAVKKAINIAKDEEGVDGIAWTTGKMQADRYKLSRKVNDIHVAHNNKKFVKTGLPYVKLSITDKNGRFINLNGITSGVTKSDDQSEFYNVPHSVLEEIIGKELAKKIINGPDSYVYSGAGLDIGGDKLAHIYDVTLPGLFKKYTQTEVEKTSIESDTDDVFRTVQYVPIGEKTPSRFALYEKATPYGPSFKTKVVNEDGSPRVVYHGTTNTFAEFDTEGKGKHTASAGYGQIEFLGSSFSADPDIADSFIVGSRDNVFVEEPGANKRRPEGAQIIPVYLHLENPKKFRTVNGLFTDMQKFEDARPDLITRARFRVGMDLMKAKAAAYRDSLILQGFDGIQFMEGPRWNPTKNRMPAYIAFSPNQIKSATANKGTYDLSKESILEDKTSEYGTKETISIPMGRRGKARLDVPRFMYHTFRPFSEPSQKDQETGIKAYDIRLLDAADLFPSDPTAKHIWLSRTPLGTRGTVKVDLSKLNPEMMRDTGQGEGNILHRGDIPESAIVRTPEFFSNTGDMIGKQMETAMPPAEWKKRIIAWGEKNSGIKDETEWSGILEYLDSKMAEKKLTKEDVLQQVEQSKDGWLKKDVTERDSRWHSRNLPGGIPGTELIHSYIMPANGPESKQKPKLRKGLAVREITAADLEPMDMIEYNAVGPLVDFIMLGYVKEGDWGLFDFPFGHPELIHGIGAEVGETLTAEQATQAFIEEFIDMGVTDLIEYGEGYQSLHFPGTLNVLLHVRTQKMRDKDGKIGLVAETIQSDWHQEGRDRGYQKSGELDIVGNSIVTVMERLFGKDGRDEISILGGGNFNRGLDTLRDADSASLSMDATWSDDYVTKFFAELKKEIAEGKWKAAMEDPDKIAAAISNVFPWRISEDQAWEVANRIITDHPTWTGLGTYIRRNMDWEIGEVNKFKQNIMETMNKEVRGGVPDAPFKDTWHEQGLKRLIAEGVKDSEVDWIGWTQGEQQAERWGKLSHRYIKRIAYVGRGEHEYSVDVEYQSDYSPDDGFARGTSQYSNFVGNLEELKMTWGAEIANAVKNKEGLVNDGAQKNFELGEVYFNRPISIGGDYLKLLYDTKLPKFANKYVKKWNTRVTPKELPTTDKNDKPIYVHSIEITSEMAEEVQEKGQPLYEKAASYGKEDIESPAFKRWFGKSKVVDKNGNPLVVYHGTGTKGITKFNIPTFFTDSKDDAEWFHQGDPDDNNTIEAYLSFQNPIYTGHSPEESKVFLALARRAGVKVETVADPLGGAEYFYSPDIAENSPYDGYNENDLVYVPAFREQLKKEGYDGVIASDVMTNYEIEVYIALSRNQIKSATNNQGTWDPFKDSILEENETSYTEEDDTSFDFGANLDDIDATIAENPATHISTDFADHLESYVSALKSLVFEGEAGKRTIDDTGESVAWNSTYPEFMQNQGWSQAEVLSALNHAQEGEQFTDRQREIVVAAIDQATDMFYESMQEWNFTDDQVTAAEATMQAATDAFLSKFYTKQATKNAETEKVARNTMITKSRYQLEKEQKAAEQKGWMKGVASIKAVVTPEIERLQKELLSLTRERDRRATAAKALIDRLISADKESVAKEQETLKELRQLNSEIARVRKSLELERSKPKKTVRKRSRMALIRIATGQNLDDKIRISEMVALKNQLRMEASAARTAMAAGNKQGLLTARMRYKVLLDRMRTQRAERAETAKIIKSLKKISGQTAKMDPQYQKIIDDLLVPLDFTTMTEVTRLKLSALKDALIADPDMDLPEAAFMAMARLDKTPIRSMSLADLRLLHQSVLHLAALGRRRGQMLIGQRTITREMLLNKILSEMKPAPAGIGPINLTTNTRGDMMDLLGKVKNQYTWHLDTFEGNVDTISGQDTMAYTVLFREIKNGSTARDRIKYELEDDFMTAKDAWDKKWRKDNPHIANLARWLDSPVEFAGMTITRNLALSLYRGYYDADFQRSVVESGFGNWGNTNPNNPDQIYNITAKAYEKAVKDMAKIEKEFADLAIPNIEKSGNLLADKFLEINGYAMPRTQSGIYWRKDTMAAALAREEDLEKGKEGFGRPAIFKGMTMSRLKGASKAVWVKPYTVAMNEMHQRAADYVGLQDGMSNASWLLYNKDFTKAINERYGKALWQELEKGLKDISGNFDGRQNAIEEFSRWLRNRSTVYALGANYITALKQLNGSFKYLSYVPPVYLARAAGIYAHSAPSVKKAHRTMSSDYRKRRESGYSQDIGNVLASQDRQGREPRWNEKISNLGFQPLQAMDIFGVDIGMLASVEYAMDSFKAEKMDDQMRLGLGVTEAQVARMTSAERLKLAYKFADMTTWKTQSMNNPENQSGWQRGTEIEKATAMFFGEAQSIIAGLARGYRAVKRQEAGGRALLIKIILFQLLLGALFDTEGNAIRAAARGQKGDAFWAGMAKSILGILPIFRNFSDAAIDKLQGKGFAFPTTVPYTQVSERVKTATSKTTKAAKAVFTGEDRVAAGLAAAKADIELLGFAFGLPIPALFEPYRIATRKETAWKEANK